MADFGINWGAIQTPNVLGSYLQGQQVRQGNEDRQYQRQRNVLADQRQARVDTRQDKEWQREDETLQRRQDAFGAYNRGDEASARNRAYEAGDTDLIAQIAALDKDKRAEASARADSLGRLAFGIKNMPYEQRKAALQAASPQLLSLGYTPEQLAGFDPNDGALQGIIASALDLKDQITLADKEADNKRADAQLGETRRHNQAAEGVSRGNLGVAQGRLGLSREAHKARLKGVGGYGTPGGGGGGISDSDVELD